MSSQDISESVFEAFHLMWGNFPAEVTLVRKNREVVAVNKALQASGRIKPGMFCSREGSPDDHKNCKANKALEACRPEHIYFMAGENPAVAFWVPLAGSNDLFVHFLVDTGSFK